MSNIPTETENVRLEILTVYNTAILARCHGSELDASLRGEVSRRGRSDSAFRQHALSFTHPDDLVTALARNGFSLASVGIEAISLAA